MDPKNAKHRMKLPFTPSQNDKVPSFDPVVQDEEGLYGIFCTRCNASNPEVELDYALIADECPPASEEFFPERTIKIKPIRVLKHRPSAIIFTEDCVWCRGSIVIGNGLPSNANIFIFNGPAQLKCRPGGEWERRDDPSWQVEHHRSELKRDQCILPCESNGARKCICSRNHPDPDEVETGPCCVLFHFVRKRHVLLQHGPVLIWLKAEIACKRE
ncbi:uncharacterized protein LOC120371953 [Mauremys reevesii]|uniref:uncharacterized protein LOC120371953 n=1 Tax=Mauremys reevesii TaxID=260615 RepID=UPI00193EE58E|nr:uncharacterized protein LOC120371953 [Mauremys reevesii]